MDLATAVVIVAAVIVATITALLVRKFKPPQDKVKWWAQILFAVTLILLLVSFILEDSH